MSLLTSSFAKNGQILAEIYFTFLKQHARRNLKIFKPIQDRSFWGCSLMGGQKDPFPKIYHTYPAKVRLSTVTHYQKKI